MNRKRDEIMRRQIKQKEFWIINAFKGDQQKGIYFFVDLTSEQWPE